MNQRHVMLHHGDCAEVMAAMDAESIDAIVTDPPYGLGFMGKTWDSFGGPLGVGHGMHRAGGREVGGAMKAGDSYDRSLVGQRGYQTWTETWGREALRVTRPGGYLLSSGGTRTFHRLAAGLEDAGWIIRDCLVWAYASGFPKSKALLKPAWEPIVMARKPGPLRDLAIDACRIGTGDDKDDQRWYEWQRGESVLQDAKGMNTPGRVAPRPPQTLGRWPANVILTDPIFDGDTPGVVGGGASESGISVRRNGVSLADAVIPMGGGFGTGAADAGYSDTGTYSRFFLVPKAARSEREPILRGTLELRERPRENTHPTVKPLDLMRHLVRLVTPAGGTVLDPFLGSGTTGLAAEMEGFQWVGIEREAEYVAIAEARLNGTQRGLGLT